jgi:hypothetical protein
LGENHASGSYALSKLTYRSDATACNISTDTFRYSFPSDSGLIEVYVTMHCPAFSVDPEQPIYEIEQDIRSLYITPLKNDSRVEVVYSQDKPTWYPWMELNPEFDKNGAVSFNTIDVPIGMHEISINYETFCGAGTIKYEINIIKPTSNFTDTILGKIVIATMAGVCGMLISYIYGKCATKFGLPDNSVAGVVAKYLDNTELSCKTDDNGQMTCHIQNKVPNKNYEYV